MKIQTFFFRRWRKKKCVVNRLRLRICSSWWRFCRCHRHFSPFFLLLLLLSEFEPGILKAKKKERSRRASGQQHSLHHSIPCSRTFIPKKKSKKSFFPEKKKRKEMEVPNINLDFPTNQPFETPPSLRSAGPNSGSSSHSSDYDFASHHSLLVRMRCR